MQSAHIVREVETPRSFRVVQVTSMFDVPLAEKTRKEWNVELPLDEKPWQIGLIVGPSGCGKSTIAQEIWPQYYTRGYPWDSRSILDNFPAHLESKTVVQALTSVGFSSPPDWIKPYSALSTGQQMRCDLARALCEDSMVVFDEFTSVVDRTVAKIGSAALAKSVRKRSDKKFVAVTCHEDVTEWLTPDWVYEPHTGIFNWRYLRRPQIIVDVYPVHRKAWPLFRPYHYMSASLHVASQCFLAEYQGQPVGFMACLPVIGFKDAMRSSRTVVLPDYQGVGIGVQLSEFVAEHYRKMGKRFRRTIAHPAFIGHHSHSPKWKLVEQTRTGFVPHGGRDAWKNSSGHGWATSTGRGVVTFEYVGEQTHE